MSGLLRLIQDASERIAAEHAELRATVDDAVFYGIREHLDDAAISPLEKAVYLLLNQFPTGERDYFVIPREHVRVRDVYGFDPPYHKDYEIDLAVYSGSADHPVKIAVECDGIRSHKERHSDRDRHKDVNLQAAGWTVVRFGSREIHRALRALLNGDGYAGGVVGVIENVVFAQSDALTHTTYLRFRSRLTGYTFGNVACRSCGETQYDRLETPGRRRKCGAPLAVSGA